MTHNSQNIEIGVIGAGYVGLVSGACFSTFGYRVTVVEINEKKINDLKSGIIPIYEPGLEEIVARSQQKDLLRFVSTTEQLCKDVSPEVVFVAVGTPDREDGSCNTDYVFEAVRQIAIQANRDTVIVLKSTVPVGTAVKSRKIIESLNPKQKIAVVNNPEFLKEGEAVSDFQKPERVVIGGKDPWALQKVKNLYEPLNKVGTQIFVTDSETAELAKLAANLVLASRVSIINQVARLSDAVGSDIKDIEKILRSDSRIGSRYLFAGLGYGGSCFPKDVKNFIHLCQEKGVNALMAQSIESFNDEQKEIFLDDIQSSFSPSKDTISVLGLGFKPNTDDIREAPALVIVQELSKKGFRIKAYDPKASAQFSAWIKSQKIPNVEVCSSLENCLIGTQALVVTTEWPEFKALPDQNLKSLFKGQKIYDGKNIYTPSQIKDLGYKYKGVGRNIL